MFIHHTSEQCREMKCPHTNRTKGNYGACELAGENWKNDISNKIRQLKIKVIKESI